MHINSSSAAHPANVGIFGASRVLTDSSFDANFDFLAYMSASTTRPMLAGNNSPVSRHLPTGERKSYGKTITRLRLLAGPRNQKAKQNNELAPHIILGNFRVFLLLYSPIRQLCWLQISLHKGNWSRVRSVLNELVPRLRGSRICLLERWEGPLDLGVNTSSIVDTTVSLHEVSA